MRWFGVIGTTKCSKKCEKKYEEAVKETWAARDKYYDMIEEYRKRGSDEGSDNDNGC